MAKQFYTAKSREDFNGSTEPYTFTGEWENGKPNGYGIKYYSDGTTNRGYFKNGMLNGYGVCHYADGVVYEGNFINDLKDGYGVEFGKIIYRGFFKEDNYHGKGVLIIPGQIDYIGDIDMENDIMHGVGMLDFHDEKGEYYVGQLYRGKREGYGKLIYGDGSSYEGEWKNNKKNGKGSVTYPNKGYRFECTFRNGLAHGCGKFISFDGRILKEGLWINGKIQ